MPTLDAEAYMDRGNANAQKGLLDEAIADYDAALRINPDFALAYYNRGLVRREMGDSQGGEEDFRKAREFGYRE